MTPRLPAKLHLAALPTPLEPMARLSAELGIHLAVKRDDLTGSHLGGNKIRKLEFLLAAALDRGATHVITCGGMQSNHARATALAAAPLGLQPVLLLRTSEGLATDLPSPPTANVLLDQIAGARLVPCTPNDYRMRRLELMQALAAEIEAAGGTAVIIPEGGSNALGALGYVAAAHEILEQCGEAIPDTIVVATGSGGTLAGLAVGLAAAGVPTRALGVAVCDDRTYFRNIVDAIADELERDFGLPALGSDRYDVLDGFQGDGYARATATELAFLLNVARKDGLVLDPVYTNKAFMALVATAKNAPERLGRRVLFIHTGGIFGLFPYAAQLSSLG